MRAPKSPLLLLLLPPPLRPLVTMLLPHPRRRSARSPTTGESASLNSPTLRTLACGRLSVTNRKRAKCGANRALTTGAPSQSFPPLRRSHRRAAAQRPAHHHIGRPRAALSQSLPRSLRLPRGEEDRSNQGIFDDAVGSRGSRPDRASSDAEGRSEGRRVSRQLGVIPQEARWRYSSGSSELFCSMALRLPY